MMEVFATSRFVAKIQIGSIGLLAISISSIHENGSLLISIPIGFAGIFLVIYSLLADRQPLIEANGETIVIREPMRRKREVTAATGHKFAETEKAFTVVREGRILLNAAKCDYGVA